jgi:hypothetical protein
MIPLIVRPPELMSNTSIKGSGWRYHCGMMRQLYEVKQDSSGYLLYRVPLGISAVSTDGKRFLDATDLRAELLDLNHTAPQIETMISALHRLGESGLK